MSGQDAQGVAKAAVPGDTDGPTFAEPWEAQAFAMVVALHDTGLFSWKEWTQALSREIGKAKVANEAADDGSYYYHWLAALEALVIGKGVASVAALKLRKAAWARAAEATPHGQPILLENDPQTSAEGSTKPPRRAAAPASKAP